MVLENRITFAQHLLITQEELKNRWQHATTGEYYDLFKSGKLQTFSHVKGPINGIVFCVPGLWDSGFGDVWWGGFDYCILSEVEQCEKEYPDFIGIVGNTSGKIPSRAIDSKQVPPRVGVASWVEVDFPLSLAELLARWQCLVEKIEPLVKKGLLIAYDKKDWVPRNGHRITRASQRPAVLGLSGPHDDIIFDMDNVSTFEGSQPAFLDSDADIDGKMDRKSYNSIQAVELGSTVSDDLYRNNIVLAHDVDGKICPPHMATFPLKIFFTEIPKPDSGDFYTSHDLMERYKLGPAEFVEYLILHKELFPHGVPDWFYIQHQYIDEIGCEYQPMMRKVEELDKLTFHYRTIRNHEKRMHDSGYYDGYYGEHKSQVRQCEAYIGNNSSHIAELETQLSEAQKQLEDVKSIRLWNKQFLMERAALQKALKEKDTNLAELRTELESTKAELESGKSLADMVCRMRREGKNDEEIAVYLHDGGKWCSQAQVGALLHADETRVAAESMSQRARRLLGKA